MKKNKICVITGTRADFGHLTPVMQAIQAEPSLKLQVVVTCMHLMREFGYTVKEIEKEFMVNARVDVSYREDSGRAMAISVGKALSGMAKVFNRLKPDVVMILGDRGEMLSAAIAANYLNIPIVHLHGGEISGHVDGVLRHAITKLAHLHFTATKLAAQRIIKMGEEPWRVHVVGAPTLDKILRGKLPSEKELGKKYGFSRGERYILIVQHPVSTEIDLAGKQMEETLAAVRAIKMTAMLIYPNADAGGRRMIKVIKKHEKEKYLHTRVSIPHHDFLGLMRSAALLVGNSSSGIIEASSFKLPVVNLGSRQIGRESGINVINVIHNKRAIIRAIKKALTDKFKTHLKKCRNPYGSGHAAERIVKILCSTKLNDKFLEKHLTY